MENKDTYIDAHKANGMGIFPCEVYCDGVLLDSCCGFDLHESYAETFVRKSNGDYDIDKAKGEVKRKRHYGIIGFKKRAK